MKGLKKGMGMKWMLSMHET